MNNEFLLVLGLLVPVTLMFYVVSMIRRTSTSASRGKAAAKSTEQSYSSAPIAEKAKPGAEGEDQRVMKSDDTT